MRTGTFYLNNSGSRWVHLVNGKREKMQFITNNGKVWRTVNYYESFGNFAVCNISYKGKRITVFPDTNLDEFIERS